MDRPEVAVTVSFVELKQAGKIKLTVEPGETEMAKKTKSMGDWRGIAEVSIGQAELKKFKAEEHDLASTMDALGEVVMENYKLTISVDTRSGAVTAALSCYADEDPNYKRTLIARGPDIAGAAALLLHKHVRLAKGVWVAEDEEDAMWG